MPRQYARRFDWDEARRLRETGMSYEAIGRRLAVSGQAVYWACNPDARARHQVYAKKWAQATCADCGGPCQKLGHRRKELLCRPCAKKRERTRFRTDAAGEVTEVRCVSCKEWKPPTQFPRNRTESEGLHRECRPCNTKAKRDWRRKNAEKDRKTHRAWRRRRRAELKAAA